MRLASHVRRGAVSRFVGKRRVSMGRVSPAFLTVVFLVAWVCGATRAHADQIRVTSGQFNAFAFVGQAVNSASGIDLVGPDGTRLLLSSFEEGRSLHSAHQPADH